MMSWKRSSNRILDLWCSRLFSMVQIEWAFKFSSFKSFPAVWVADSSNSSWVCVGNHWLMHINTRALTCAHVREELNSQRQWKLNPYGNAIFLACSIPQLYPLMMPSVYTQYRTVAETLFPISHCHCTSWEWRLAVIVVGLDCFPTEDATQHTDLPLNLPLF